MPFAVYTQQTNGFQTVVLEDLGTLTNIKILPEAGAMLYSFEVQTEAGVYNVIDNYPDPATLNDELVRSYKSCKLSPFPCRIPGGTYVHNERTYTLEQIAQDGSSIHGLLYNKLFKVVDEFCDDSLVGVHLKYSYKKEDAGYPFEYRCDVRYTLFPRNVLQVQTIITNLDVQDIPIADGWHPYFKLGGKVDDWVLQFNASSMLEFNEGLVPTGQLLNYDRFIKEQSLEGVELDNSFLLNKNGDDAACILSNPSNNLSVSFFPDGSYPYLQIYIPSARDSIAIETLSAPPDAFNNKIGLIQLPPGNSKTFTVYYKTNIE